ncbi:metal-sensitive transcriptional regulator [Isachenkonia alkalipeptolytica]|uniref:Metal-sensing transcriptional repressor n=1 Tax=Isachenkonia alkalipeptolytica TaxID=2565777 RepID=A0AA44BEM3_9CLOT|nr:metal-sensitive transcriptional regulator [Isachenkonia alkalipeptolytica]NBG89097.1 metal-sensing transcriptional repressor [Isachenkonia alkalipeptolytica]
MEEFVRPTSEKAPTAEAAKKQKALLDRMSRIEGQLRGIRKMIEQDTYCDDVINQIEASRSALKSVQLVLLDNHIKHCVKAQLQQGEDEVIEEVLKTVKRLTK